MCFSKNSFALLHPIVLLVVRFAQEANNSITKHRIEYQLRMGNDTTSSGWAARLWNANRIKVHTELGGIIRVKKGRFRCNKVTVGRLSNFRNPPEGRSCTIYAAKVAWTQYKELGTDRKLSSEAKNPQTVQFQPNRSLRYIYGVLGLQDVLKNKTTTIPKLKMAGFKKLNFFHCS